MVKYIEATNVFRIIDDFKEQYLIFIANNTLALDVVDGTSMKIRVNNIPVEVATVFFNNAISFVPCFQYTDSEDVVLFASNNLKFHVDSAGQYCTGVFRNLICRDITVILCLHGSNSSTEFAPFRLLRYAA